MTQRSRIVIALLALLASAGLSADRTDIHPSAEAVQPLLPGMKAPAFTVRTPTGDAVRFDPDNLERPVVITFYRGGWCPYCNLHLSEMRHAEDELQALGYDVWFLSMDAPQVLAPSLDMPEVDYTLLSDALLEASRGFGIAFRVDDETYDRYAGMGLDLEKESGEDHHVLPAPATYVIGPDGVIRFSYVNPDYKMRLAPEVLVTAAREIDEESEQRLVRQRQAQRTAEG